MDPNKKDEKKDNTNSPDIDPNKPTSDNAGMAQPVDASTATQTPETADASTTDTVPQTSTEEAPVATAATAEPEAEVPDPAAATPTPPVPPATPDGTAPTEMSPGGNGGDLGYTETKSNKLVYVLVFVLVVILLSLVGLFFYKQYTNSTAESTMNPSPVAEQPTPTPEEDPTVTPVNEEEEELQNIEIPDIEEDLEEIEADLEQL